IIIILTIFSLVFIISGGSIVYYIEKTTSTMNNIIMLHQVELLRDELLIKIKRVQGDFSLRNSRHAKGIDTIIKDVSNMGEALNSCYECHHTKDVASMLDALKYNLNEYKSALSRVFTIRANFERLEQEEDNAFRIGQKLSTEVKEILAFASGRLEKKTEKTQEEISQAKFAIFILLSLGPLFIIIIAYYFIKDLSKPIDLLLDATRKLKGGELDYKLEGLEGEFGEVAASFNEMGSALQMHMGQLQESEKRYRTLFESANDAIFILDMNGNFLDVNSVAYQRLGYTKEELLAMHIAQLDPPEFAAKVPERLREIQEQGKAVFESAHRRKDGSIMPVEINSKILSMKGEEVFFSVIRDISLRKQLEEKLLEVKKLESTGILAGGIAHDFNNILTGILGNISLAKHQTKPSDSIFDKLAKAEKAALRAKGLTQQLLTFASGGSPIKKTMSLLELIQESTGFVLSGSNIKCQYFLQENLWAVDVDPGQLSQVIQNLIINATHAMPNGGVITVSAENVTNAEQEVSLIAEEKYIKLEVTDRGIGIPEKDIKKIFDPYFTSKQLGSGLGLASCYSIIKNHAGQIIVDSEVGVGTTFTIYLPVSDKTLLKKEETQQTIYPGKGKILIMDDEEIIREFAYESLKYAGYEVEVVCDGRDAVDCYQKAQEANQPFAAAILDLTIPGGMGGKETLEKLLAIDPEVKAIVSSGYFKDPIMANFAQYGFMGVAPKPYKIEELSKVLYEILK
ncbi:MAG: PAS domain S-box protein, partial [Desulfobulbaceae bacterium]|nr:PAS domain S-box protein [Desulfobulbaceae bacterium]